MNQDPTNESDTRAVPRGIRRGQRGRFASTMPGETKPVLVHLDQDAISALDAQAEAAGETRSVALRRILAQVLFGQVTVAAADYDSKPDEATSAPRVAVARSQAPQNPLSAAKKFQF